MKFFLILLFLIIISCKERKFEKEIDEEEVIDAKEFFEEIIDIEKEEEKIYGEDLFEKDDGIDLEEIEENKFQDNEIEEEKEIDFFDTMKDEINEFEKIEIENETLDAGIDIFESDIFETIDDIETDEAQNNCIKVPYEIVCDELSFQSFCGEAFWDGWFLDILNEYVLYYTQTWAGVCHGISWEMVKSDTNNIYIYFDNKLYELYCECGFLFKGISLCNKELIFYKEHGLCAHPCYYKEETCQGKYIFRVIIVKISKKYWDEDTKLVGKAKNFWFDPYEYCPDLGVDYKGIEKIKPCL